MNDFQCNKPFSPSNSPDPYRYVVLPPSLIPNVIALWCVIDGDPVPFKISLHRDADVDDLKDAIKGKKNLRLDPTGLALWMLTAAEPLQPQDTLAQRIRLRGDVATFANQLTISEQTMSALFPERPLNNHVHILVRFLSTGPSWLVEIHSELWGRRDLFGDIFRTATLTKDDFIELQCQLQELNPERTSKDYVANDVLTTKSAFLRSRSTALNVDLGSGLVPRPVFDASQPPSSDVVDNDAVADDAMDIDPDHCSSGHVNTHLAHLSKEATAIFPYTIRYVDLTVLKSKKWLRVPRLMLFRNEWASMIDIFNERKKGIAGSAVFSGQPGIGKTCLLYSILVLSMVFARPIVFQDMYGNVFVIGNTVCPKDTPVVSEDANDVLTLVDADRKNCEPVEYLLSHDEHRILVTSSPRKSEDRKWLTQSVRDEHGVFMMKLWSRSELIVTSVFLQDTDATLERLQEASHICGNIPRTSFAATRSSRDLRNAEDNIKCAIEGTKELSDIIINVMSGETVIHRAFQIRPSFEDRLWNSCFVEPVSNWALSKMMGDLHRRGKDEAHRFYCALQGSPVTATLCRRTFEIHLHQFLKTPRTYTIESLNNRPSTLEIHFTSNTKLLTFGDMKCFSGHLASSVQSNTSCYLQPLSPVFPSFDSFLYQPGISQPGFSALIALQVTTAADHAVNVKSLQKVQTSLKPQVSELEKLRPINDRKMIILFVVPDTLRATFVKQTIEGTDKDLWYNKTAQYILPLPEEEVLRAT